MIYRWLLRLVLSSTVVAGCGDGKKPPGTVTPDAGMLVDAGPVEIPLERAHAGGSPEAMVLVGKRAYIAVGPRLAIWDLEPSVPTLVGETAPMRGVIGAVAAAGDRVYVAERTDLDSMIHVLDVTNPNAPVETHAFSVANGGYSFIHDLDTASGRLYVADQEQGIVELDLADPDAPVHVRTVPPSGVTGLAVVGTRLYYTSESFIGGASAGVLDRNNDLANLGSAPLGNVKGVAFAAQNLVVGAGADGIYVYDVTDPSNPVERFHHGEVDMGPFARAIATHGNTAWVPAHDGLHTLDLTTPTAIVHHGPATIDTVGVNAAAANGDVLAIVTDRGRLLSLGVTNPTQPTSPRIVDVTLCANCVGVSAADATVYIADIVGGLRTASLANLASQGRSPPLPTMPNSGGLQFVFEDVVTVGPHAFIADWLYGLRVYDVTTPSAITAVSSIVTGGAPSAVTVAGDRAYIAEGTNGGFLKIIDVTDRASPVLLGGIETSKAMDVEVRGKYAYVADESLFGPGGLKIFDISDPAKIAPLGVYNTDCLYASDVALLDNFAVVACADDGFHWVDISNPAAPTRVAVTEPANAFTALSVATWEGHAALGTNRGVIVMNVATTQTVATYDTSWPVRAIAVPSAGRIVAACGAGGVYQWKL